MRNASDRLSVGYLFFLAPENYRLAIRRRYVVGFRQLRDVGSRVAPGHT